MADTKHPRRKPATRKPTTRKPAAKASRPAARSGHGTRTVAIGVATGLGAIAAIVAGFSLFARRTRAGEHRAPDLAADRTIGSERAPEAFRPDPTAPVPASEREGLRPATGPGPSLVATRGEMANQTGAANG